VNDELTGPRGDGYRRMLTFIPLAELERPAKLETSARCSWVRVAPSSPGRISIMDGGVTSSYFYGELAPH